MIDVAHELKKTGNDWAVAITKSQFTYKDRGELIKIWNLVDVKSTYEIDPHFGRCLAQVGENIHGGDRTWYCDTLLVEAKPQTMQSFDPVHVALVIDKSILSFFMLDEQVEREIRKIAISAKRVKRIHQDLTNILETARLHKNYSKKKFGCEGVFDATACNQMLQEIETEKAALSFSINAMIERVRIF